MKKAFFALGLMCIFLSSCVLLDELWAEDPMLPTETQTSGATEIVPTSTKITVPANTVIPSATPLPLPTLTPTAVPYALQPGTPLYSSNFGYPDAGCNWMGVSGQIFDENGKPVINLVIWIRGNVDDRPFEAVVLTGTAEGDKYGPGGYEALLSTTALETTNNFSIQVLDLNGNLLTDQIFFDTHAACDQNLILINFTKK